MPDNADAATTLPTTINQSTTLNAAGSPYLGPTTVASGVTLTIEPGVVWKPYGTTMINGALIADGTPADPIQITSQKDDSVGGDTNGDGSATQPAAGDWSAIRFSGSGTGVVDNVRARFGGNSGFGGPYSMIEIQCPCANPASVTNSTLSKSKYSAIRVNGAGSPQITDNTISSSGFSGSYAIDAPFGGSPEIARNQLVGNWGGINVGGSGSNQGQIRVHDNFIDETASASGLNVFLPSGMTVGSLSGNAITDGAASSTEPAMSFSGTPIHPDVDEQSITGNARNALAISGNVGQSITWQAHNFPILWNNGTVNSGTTLTLGPGAKLKPSGITTVNGTLSANGTAADPIQITSQRDDSVGGDTNGDGSSTQPAVGDWSAIRFTSSATGVIDQTEISFGGNSGFGGPYSMIEIQCPCANPVSVTNSLLRKAKYSAIRLTGAGSPQITGNTINTSGSSGSYAIDAQLGGSPEIANNQLSGNWGGIVAGGSGSMLGQIKVHDNVVDGTTDAAGIQISLSSPMTTGNLSGNTISDGIASGSPAMSFSGSSIPVDVDENTILGNARNVLALAGNVTQSQTWQGHSFAIHWGNATIEAGKTLSLGPGIELKLAGSTTVNGTLVADGTSTEPVNITSQLDDAVGGDTNGDGTATQPAAGNWGSLIFNQTSGNSLIRQSRIRYGTSVTIACPCPSPPAIRNVEFSRMDGTSVSVAPGAVGLGRFSNDIIVSHSDFLSTGRTAIERSSGISIRAPHNYFGAVDGPSPGGSGASVSGNVDVDPFRSTRNTAFDTGASPPDEQRAVVPNCTGSTIAACKAALAAVGFEDTRTADVAPSQFDHTAAPGHIAITAPLAETVYPLSSEVTLYRNPPRPDYDRALLQRFAPTLIYDNDEVYAADSVRLATDRKVEFVTGIRGTNKLERDALNELDSGFGLEPPALTLEYLGHPTYANGVSTSSLDQIDYGPYDSAEDISHDADILKAANPSRYSNKTYARVVDADGATWLQYWFFYTHNPSPPGSLGGGDHEGDWELAQVRLYGDPDDGSLSLEPTEVAAAAHSGGSVCAWSDVNVVNGTSPMVYVAVDSHASYLTTGTFGTPVVADDDVDGDGAIANPEVNMISDTTSWIRWPGTWGSDDGLLTGSPPGPMHQSGNKWSSPQEWADALGDQHCATGANARAAESRAEDDESLRVRAVVQSQALRVELLSKSLNPRASTVRVVARRGSEGGVLTFERVVQGRKRWQDVVVDLPAGKGRLSLLVSQQDKTGAFVGSREIELGR